VPVVASPHPRSGSLSRAGTQQPSTCANTVLRASPSDAVPALALALCSQHQAPLEHIKTGTAHIWRVSVLKRLIWPSTGP
jgi:hypothetical protein